jgi:hypothetical protein
MSAAFEDRGKLARQFKIASDQNDHEQGEGMS